MKNIPFKPLSERMLEEPFWLGLITVTIVLIVIGICYLLKKHMPEQLEKFISEDIESGKLVEKSSHHQGQNQPHLAAIPIVFITTHKIILSLSFSGNCGPSGVGAGFDLCEAISLASANVADSTGPSLASRRASVAVEFLTSPSVAARSLLSKLNVCQEFLESAHITQV